ncbi:hypothetical protein D3C73_1389560 [compost metagenome]
MLTAAHPAPELMKLGQAEPVGVHDDHQGGVGHIDTDFDDGGGYKYLHLIAVKSPHYLVLLGRRHSAVQKTYTVAWKGSAKLNMEINRVLDVELVRLFDQRTYDIGLSPLIDFAADEIEHALHLVRLDPIS